LFCDYSNTKEIVKDLAEIFYKQFTTLATMVAVKCTHSGERLFAQHYTIYSASVYILMAYFLVWMLQTLLQLQHPISIFPIPLLLLLGYAVCFLALTLISWKIALSTLLLWVLTSAVAVIFNNYYYQQEFIKTVSAKISKVFERYINIPPQLKDQLPL